MLFGSGLSLAQIASRSSSSGGGGGDYVDAAVTSDGSVQFLNNALAAPPDGPYFAFSLFFKLAPNAYEGSSAHCLFITNPAFGCTELYFFPGAGAGSGLKVYLSDFEANEYVQLDILGTDNKPAVDVWHSLIVAADTQNQVYKLYLNRVDRTHSSSGSGNPFDMQFNGVPFVIFTDTYDALDAYVGSVANLRLMMGQNLLVDGDIPSATLDLFVTADGHMVDPAVATAELGAPTVQFFGTASNWNTQAATQGFTVTGTLTDAGSVPPS